MTKAFVSYSRKDTEFTRKLTDALIEQNLELWVDWKNIPPTVDWKLQIQKGVEEADTFLFLISPDSIKSRECAEELIHAIKNNKRLIPLVVRDIKAEDAPKELKHINWIFFDKPDCFDESFHKLLEAINTDYEWVQTHSRLQVKALEWERHKKDHSLLLRGMELENMEGQLVVNASKEPTPTDIQREYVLESKKAKEAERKAREKQRRIITGGSVVVALAMIVLAFWAYGQKLNADEQRKEADKQKSIAEANEKKAQDNEQKAQDNATFAQIGELSALAVGRIDQDYNEALLYSVEAYRQAEETGFNRVSAQSALLTTLQSRQGLLQILQGHNDWITALTYSPDGSFLASSSWDNVTIIWDTADPSNPQKLEELQGKTVAFSPTKDNPMIATTSSEDNTVQLWSYDKELNLKKLGTFAGNRVIAFTPNGKNIITITYDDNFNFSLEIWDISSTSKPALVKSLPGDDAVISSNGELLLVRDGMDSEIKLLDISNPNEPIEITSLPGGLAAFNPTGDLMAIVNYETAEIELYNITNPATPQKLGGLAEQADNTSSMVFSQDGSTLIIGSDMGNIYLWYVSDPTMLPTKPFETLHGHTLPVNYLAFNPKNQLFASGSNDGTVLLWDINKVENPLQIKNLLTGQNISDINPYSNYVSTILSDIENENQTLSIWDISDMRAPAQFREFALPTGSYVATVSPDGRFAVIAGTDPEKQVDFIEFWDITNTTSPIPVQTFAASFLDAVFSSDGRTLFLTRGETGTENTIVSIWDISDPSSPAEVNKTQSTAGVSEVVISLDGELAAYSKYSGSGAAKMTILDLSSPGQVQVRGELEGDQASFSPDGTLIAIPNVSQPDGTFAIQLWDTSDLSAKKELGSLKGFPKAIKTIAFSPDGKLFAAGCDDKTITIWDISKPAAPRKLSTLSGHSDWINTVVFSPDGKILASGSDDKNIVLWGVEDPNDIVQIGTLKGHLSSVSEVFYSADGRALLSRERTGPAFLWDIDPSSWMDKACHIVGSNFSDDKWAQLFPDKTYRETCVNMLLTSIEPPAPIEELTSSSPTTLPACSDPSGTAGCPLLTVDERDRFCIDSVSYTLYALPEGTTLTPPDSSYTCTNEGVRGGFQMYTCYSLEHPNTSFQANVCNTSCQVVGSDQCESGFGLDSSQSCCAPVSSDGCFEVTLEIGGCTQ